jgi:hypothetical protein
MTVEPSVQRSTVQHESAYTMSRKSLLAKIHIAKKELGLDDETYRDTLEGITGKRSASKLSDKQLATVLDVFKKHGFKPKKIDRFQSIDDPRKAIALWKNLYREGPVNDGSPEALYKFAQRLTCVDRVEWMMPGDWSTVIEALKDWCLREGIDFA